MAKVMGSESTIEAMVNCKTYPAVSKKYIETVCTGGVQADGQFVRLYPIPFRLLEAKERYDRWDVIRLRAYKDTNDTRPESWHVMSEIPIEVIKTVSSKKERWDWMKRTIHQSADEMESKGITNGCVEIEPLEFYWKADPKEWTANQLGVIQQNNLFVASGTLKDIAERVPWEFRLKYREKSSGAEFDAKVLAWSYYQGYRRHKAMHDDQTALQMVGERVSKSIFHSDRTVFAILGTHKAFGHWMVSALYHVPNEIIEDDRRKGATLF